MRYPLFTRCMGAGVSLVLAPRANLEPVSGLGRGLRIGVPAALPLLACEFALGSELAQSPQPGVWPGLQAVF